MTDPLVRSHQLTRADVRGLVGTVVRETVLPLRLLVLIAADLVAGIVLLIVGPLVVGIVLVALGVVLLIPAVVQRGRVMHTLDREGVRPGTQISAEYFAQRFVVTVNGAPISRYYTDVRDVRTVNGIVLVRMTTTGAPPMRLPEPLVPDEARRLLAAGN